MPKYSIMMGIAAGISMGMVSNAQASFLDLPEHAPVPISRTEGMAIPDQLSVPSFRVIKIGTTPEAIPLERQNVRIVGARFLPPIETSLTQGSPTPAWPNFLDTMATACDWVIKSASARIFGVAAPAPDQTIASLEDH